MFPFVGKNFIWSKKKCVYNWKFAGLGFKRGLELLLYLRVSFLEERHLLSQKYDLNINVFL